MSGETISKMSDCEESGWKTWSNEKICWPILLLACASMLCSSTVDSS